MISEQRTDFAMRAPKTMVFKTNGPRGPQKLLFMKKITDFVPEGPKNNDF